MAEGRVPTTSVSVIVAHDLLLAGHRYLDVRTPEEFSQGHACGAINVPYMKRGDSGFTMLKLDLCVCICFFFLFLQKKKGVIVNEAGMSKNPSFLEQVSSHFGEADKIIVGCQSGGRSLKATAELLDAGFTGVTDIAGGYAAWTQNGLPTQED
ncbi:hypothetical protein EUTSA_v10005068mg [Eutrema salsugineum]|uniref:Rhodanese domain-containing protein n=1 Tax=Eutrema salsugineum TaxID=72664 RepID=V4KMD8_EUTSA|nr:thiosulfate sulfurtransferase 16, chloroplastic isoform X1 [Eutrema salsugineum]ESQ31077.1 hypothetical protein EUTSA_v10005068mg [Eutrema salsugineum]